MFALKIIFIFIILMLFFYKILSLTKLKIIISPITMSIIIALIVTKVISYNLYNNKNEKSHILEKELIVGISPDYSPYAFIDKNTIVGFDIDLLELIAKKLSLKLKLVPMPFHSILVALQLNTIMLAASGLSATEERAKHMLISDSYFKNDYLCAISLKENSFDSIDKIKNKKIIINIGYSSENYLNAIGINENILKLKSVPDGLLGLTLKQGDVFITSYTSLSQLLKTKEAEKFFIFTLPQNNTNQEQICFLVNKKETQLLNNINKIINTFLEDGTIKHLTEKWKLL